MSWLGVASRARPAGGTTRGGILESWEELERVLQTSVRRVGGLAARVRQILFPQHQGDISKGVWSPKSHKEVKLYCTGTPTTTKAKADTERQRGALGRGRRTTSLIVTFDNGDEGDKRLRERVEEGSRTKIERLPEVKKGRETRTCN
jgi:hypothetical protein